MDQENLLERVEQLEAKEAIREVLYRFARAVDRADSEMLKSVYHEDGTDVHGRYFSGNAHDFVDYMIPWLTQSLVNRHTIGNILIELDGDRAFVESYYVATHRIAMDGVRAADLYGEGRYIDILEKRRGVWKILHRLVIGEKHWTREATVSHTAPMMDGLQPAIGSKADPVYLGFAALDVSTEAYKGDDPFAALLAEYGGARG